MSNDIPIVGWLDLQAEDKETIIELLKDSERLEWLVYNEAFPMKSKEGWCLTSDGNTCWGVAAETWRDAIDEAME